ncbi:hypothetical protein ABZ646_40370 [Streptomyces sp. NPDC007162]|uniref:hypothetical protein n=1 Tax=Streptomyces sp. NPDC007162 TaxID=3156917 RepID=UPI0033E23631
MTAGRCARTVRSAVFAAVCVLLAAVGHVLMSGSPVPAWAFATGLLATTVVGWSLAGRERGLPLVVCAAVGAQTALHSGFSAAQAWTAQAAPVTAMHMDMTGGTTGGTTGAMTGGMADMHMASAPPDPVAYLGFGSTGPAATGMLAAHLLAALLCGLWLGHGERAAFRVLRAVAGRLTAPLRLLLALPAPAGPPRPRPYRRRSERAPRLLLLGHAITTRGPPAGTAVA